MKFKLIKLLCIVGAGILGALLVGDPLAGVLIAPFGWIAGKTVEVWSEAGKVPVKMVRDGGQVLESEKNRFDLFKQFNSRIYDPYYSFDAINLYYEDYCED
jgi:hypothetical protein